MRQVVVVSVVVIAVVITDQWQAVGGWVGTRIYVILTRILVVVFTKAVWRAALVPIFVVREIVVRRNVSFCGCLLLLLP